jgi:hypothetical protein
MKQDIRQQSSKELSLIVFNTELLYNFVAAQQLGQLRTVIHDKYDVNSEQLRTLEIDITNHLVENAH